MAIVQEINLNMIPEGEPVIVHVNQYDTGTGRIIAHLYHNDLSYSPSSATVTIQGTKPDMHGFSYSATIDGSAVTADVTQQMTAVAGDVMTQIIVTESSGRTGTFVFILRVQSSALDDDTIISDTELPAIIDEAEANADRAEANADRAEAAVTHYPKIVNDYWYVWNVSTGQWVNTNVKAKGEDSVYFDGDTLVLT